MKKLFFALVIALTAATGVQAQSKVAHVNSQKLLDTLPSHKKGVEEIGFFQKKGIEELTEMDAAVKKLYDEYTKLPAGSSPTIVQYSQDRVTKAQQALEMRQAELEQQIQRMTEEMNIRTLASVKEAIDVIAKKKGLNYVIDEAGALFVNGTDITNEVIVELLKIDARKSASTPTPPTPQ